LVNPYHVNKTKELEDNSPTKNGAFTEVYEHLTKRDNNRLTGKQALVALSVRLIKVIYALCTKKELYSHGKVHGLESY